MRLCVCAWVWGVGTVLAFLHDGGEGRAERHRDGGEEGGGAKRYELVRLVSLTQDARAFRAIAARWLSNVLAELYSRLRCVCLVQQRSSVQMGQLFASSSLKTCHPAQETPKQLESESSMQTSFRALQLVPPLHGWSGARWRWKARAPSLVEE